jgi:transposase
VIRARGPDVRYSMADSLEQQLRRRLTADGKPDWAKHKIQRAPQPKSPGPRRRPPGQKTNEPMSEEEQAAICAFILDGHSMAKASEMFGRSPASVQKALRTQNVVSMHPTPEASRAAVADYTAQRRRILYNKILDRVEMIVDHEEPQAKDMKDLAIAVGITVDKRRLDDGEATQRSEAGSIGESRQKLQDKLDSILRNRTASAATTYEAIEDDKDTPGELYELEHEAVYEDEDADAPLQRPSTWGLVEE